jgi:hypothetical protein
MSKYILDAINTSRLAFTSAEEALFDAGYGNQKLSGLNANQAKAVAKIASEMNMAENNDIWGVGRNFMTDFEALMTSKDFSTEQKSIIAREIAALQEDPSNREKWEGLEEVFKDYGVPITNELASFVDNAI